MIIIAPYARKLKNGQKNARNYPNFETIVKALKSKGHHIIQVGVNGEEVIPGVDDVRFHLSLPELKQLIQKSFTTICVCSFFHHLVSSLGKKSIVLWSVDDPKIFSYPQNINLLKNRSYLAPNQFATYEEIPYNPDAFIDPQEVIAAFEQLEQGKTMTEEPTGFKTFTYDGKIFPDYIRNGNHAQYILPVAQQVCQGKGLDVGGGKWPFPGSQLCDIQLTPPWNDALHIPAEDNTFDFVFSSHCLEHIPNYIDALKEWIRVLKPNGTLFLYLPDVSCDYWRPVNNSKHVHIFRQEDITYDLKKLGITDIFQSGVDLAYSFAIFGKKNP